MAAFPRCSAREKAPFEIYSAAGEPPNIARGHAHPAAGPEISPGDFAPWHDQRAYPVQKRLIAFGKAEGVSRHVYERQVDVYLVIAASGRRVVARPGPLNTRGQRTGPRRADEKIFPQIEGQFLEAKIRVIARNVAPPSLVGRQSLPLGNAVEAELRAQVEPLVIADVLLPNRLKVPARQVLQCLRRDGPGISAAIIRRLKAVVGGDGVN